MRDNPNTLNRSGVYIYNLFKYLFKCNFYVLFNMKFISSYSGLDLWRNQRGSALYF